MSTTTSIIVRDPVSARELFDAARSVVGNPELWDLHDGTAFSSRVNMYQTQCDQGAKAMVSVHFPADGGLLPAADTEGQGGYARVDLSVTGDQGAGEIRARHAELAAALGRWLDARGISWCWAIEDDPWTDGRALASRPQ
jgi:hypothetical protein